MGNTCSIFHMSHKECEEWDKEMDRENNILSFISAVKEAHSLMSNIFTEGSCFNFYMILKQVYSDAVPYYNGDHVITNIGRRFYDINGVVKDVEAYEPLYQYYSMPSKVEKLINQLTSGEVRLQLLSVSGGQSNVSDWHMDGNSYECGVEFVLAGGNNNHKKSESMNEMTALESALSLDLLRRVGFDNKTVIRASERSHKSAYTKSKEIVEGEVKTVGDNVDVIFKTLGITKDRLTLSHNDEYIYLMVDNERTLSLYVGGTHSDFEPPVVEYVAGLLKVGLTRRRKYLNINIP